MAGKFHLGPLLRSALLGVLLVAASAGAQRLCITTAQLDSLQLPYSLHQLTSPLQEAFRETDPDVTARVYQIVKTFYHFGSAKRELELSRIQAGNLRAVWQLNLKLADAGDVTDLELLSSHNAYLSKAAAVIAKEAECRTTLLEIVRLALLTIETDQDSLGREADQSSD